MDNSNYIRIANSLKYVALYWNLGFIEEVHDEFVKNYNKNTKAIIHADKQLCEFRSALGTSLKIVLDNHQSFVVLEVIDRLIELNYQLEDFNLDTNNNNLLTCKDLIIHSFAWDELKVPEEISDGYKYQIYYQSRLVSGCIEFEYFVDYKGNRYNEGIFEDENQNYSLKNRKELSELPSCFIVKGTKLVGYKGNDKIVRVPEGVTHLGPSVFWDNQSIEEVIFPDSVVNMGGDTFYNCHNLKRFTIPKSVKFMGDNPFAGCKDLTLTNLSPNFIYENGALYNKDKTTIIYYNLKNPQKEFAIDEKVRIVGKHSFYLCNLEKVVIPESVLCLRNNPFSASPYLHIECHTKRYKVIDDVIYTGDLTTIVGALNAIKTERLVLEPVEVISRNAFYNCKGIETIVLPKTLKEIGYNPFVNCSNIKFESNTEAYVVLDGVLYTKDLKKIVCYPACLAKGKINIKETVETLERGAFSGCKDLEAIELHNISIIGKSCFTNCDSLKEIYLSDLVSYIGEWAFAHCKNLRKLSCYQDCYIDKRVFENTNCKLEVRKTRTNYLIESDNLYTLEAMLDSYKGKIDSICIDPPYNSHIDYIGYKDGNYSEGYLNFMGKRMELSYDLLSDKGFLVINIDEGEVENLFRLACSIFDETLVTVHRWKKKHPYFDVNRVVLNPNKKQTDYEYIIICKKSQLSMFKKLHQPYLEDDKLLEKESEVPETFDCFGTTSSAKDEIKEIFGTREYFSTPKPLKLMKELIRATTDKNSIVLDFFAGSGTTGHAVHDLNLEDNFNRKFILISNSESNICKEVTKKRLDYIKANYKFLE